MTFFANFAEVLSELCGQKLLTAKIAEKDREDREETFPRRMARSQFAMLAARFFRRQTKLVNGRKSTRELCFISHFPLANRPHAD
jgi:hypothetical protein